MKKQLAMLAVAMVAVAPMVHAQATTAPAQEPHHGMMMGPGHRGGAEHERMMQALNLTDAQKAQVKAIHQKYDAQFKALHQTMKPQMDAMRAARQKGDTAAMRAQREQMRSQMEPMRKLHEQEMAEVRAILTPAQQQQFDAMKAKFAKRGAKGGHWGKRGGAHKGAATGAGAQ